jgi:hypothetical protein
VVLVALLFTAAFTVANAQQATVARVQAQAPAVKKWGGVVLVVVGVWFLVLATFADFFAGLFPV